MNNKADQKKHIAWLWSLAINIGLLLLVLAVTDVMYETNDDFQVAKEIAEGYPFVGFVNYYLCRGLIAVQNLFPEYNIFVISQIAFAFISFVVIIRTVIYRSSYKSEIILATAICAFVALDHYSCIQFTKTAALLMTAGLIWLADNYTHERSIASYIAASLLYIAGAAYRQKTVLPTIAFLVCYLAVWFLLNRKSFAEKSLISETLVAAILIAVIIAPYGMDYISDNKNISTAELKNARYYQSHRISVTDYPVLKFYDEDESASKAYDEVGLSRNDLYFVTHFVLDYDGAASIDNLEKINEINKPYVKESRSIVRSTAKAIRSAIAAIRNFDFNGIHMIICGMMAVLILALNTRRTTLYTLAIAIASILIYSAVYYIQRPQYRALYVVDVGAALWLLYINVTEEKRSNANKFSVLLLVFSVITASLLYPGIRSLESHHKYNVSKTDSEEFEEYLRNNEDKFFVTLENVMGQPRSYLSPLMRPSYPVNLSGTGGWETLSPYKIKQLEQYGIENPIKDIINNNDAFLIGDYKIDSLTEYYNKWYCLPEESIDIVRVDEYDGEGIYQVILH